MRSPPGPSIPARLGLALASAAVAAASPGGSDVAAVPSAVWPLAPVEVLRPFEPSEPFGPGHRGIDLRAAPGQQVLAATGGVVAVAGDVAGRPVVVVEDGPWRTSYLPVRAVVSVGDRVGRGDRIGWVVDASHCPTLAPSGSGCLHWGARVDGRYVDPSDLVGATSVLLPLGDASGSDAAAATVASSVAVSRRGRRGVRAAAARPWCASGRSGSR